MHYGSQNVAIFKIVGMYIQDKIFNIQVCSFNIQDIKLLNYYTFKIQVYNSIFKIQHSIFKFVPSMFKIAYSVFKFGHSTFKFGIQYSGLSRDTSLAMVMISLTQANLVRYYYHLPRNRRNYHGMACICMYVQLELNMRLSFSVCT